MARSGCGHCQRKPLAKPTFAFVCSHYRWSHNQRECHSRVGRAKRFEERWRKESHEYEDFSQVQRRSEEKKKDDEGWEAQEGLLRFGKEERQDTKRSGATDDRSQKYQEIGSDQVSEGEKGLRKAEKGAQED